MKTTETPQQVKHESIKNARRLLRNPNGSSVYAGVRGLLYRVRVCRITSSAVVSMHGTQYPIESVYSLSEGLVGGVL